MWPAMDITVPGTQWPALLAGSTCSGWNRAGTSSPLPNSKNRCRYRSLPNMVPHSISGSRSGAPSTFSITYGTPAAASTGRSGSIRSMY